MKNITLLLLFIFTLLCKNSNAQKFVCLTLDDLPLVNYGNNDSNYYTLSVQQIIDVLHKNKIPAIGFINEDKLYVNNKFQVYRLQLIEHWLKSGLELGNHTFSHLNYNNSSLKKYKKDLLKGAEKTASLLTQHDGYRYFRHPYLQIGDTESKTIALNTVLEQNRYKVAPVTIDNLDYVFAFAYQKTLLSGDSATAKKIAEDYINHLKEVIDHYENLSQQLFGRQINQILLLHNNLINAHYLQAVVDAFHSKNYSFINLKEALKDHAYHSPITHFGKYGISWLDRWALSQKKGLDILKNEPKVPKYIMQMMD